MFQPHLVESPCCHRAVIDDLAAQQDLLKIRNGNAPHNEVMLFIVRIGCAVRQAFGQETADDAAAERWRKS